MTLDEMIAALQAYRIDHPDHGQLQVVSASYEERGVLGEPRFVDGDDYSRPSIQLDMGDTFQ